MTRTGSYVYLAARDVPDDAVAGALGMSGAPLRLVHNAGLAAVVSTVDLDEFGEEGLRRNLEDLGWLERVARTHDDVVNRIGRLTAVAPWRLATIMLDDDRVAELLATWQTELHASLDRVQGCSEWSVKMYADTPDRSTAAAGAPAETGTADLLRRKSETSRRAEAADQAAADADRVHERLSRLTVASRRLPAQDRRLTHHKGQMVLNGAYLVPDAQGGDFQAAVTGLGDELPGARLELAGPWPPYSFATLETGAGSAS
jgi:hypothetical protein